MRFAGLVFLIAASSFAQVQNAADADFGGNTGVLAPGSRAVVGYIPNAGSAAGSATVFLLPVNSTTPFTAQVLSQSQNRIVFVVPNEMPLGPAQVIYKPAGQATQWTSVTIVPASLSLYRTGPSGPLIAPIVDLRGSGVASGLTRPAQPGFGVEIFGSGLGATPLSQIHITLGGVSQAVTYAAVPPQTPGIHQINFIVAPGTPDGCYVPLVVTYGTQSVSSFLSKTSDGKPCHHPWALSQQDLTTLDNGNGISVAEIQLTTGINAASSSRASRQESGQIIPRVLDAGQIAANFANPYPAQPCGLVSPIGAAFFGALGGTPSSPGQLTHAGVTLFLPYTSSSLTAPIRDVPPVIAPGLWTFLAGPASFSFPLPPPIQLSGGAPITINHTQNSTITWDSSGYDTYATLHLSLKSAAAPVVSCTIPAQAGIVTIPPNLLASFIPGSVGVISVSVNETGAGIPSGQTILNGAPVLALAIWSSTDTRPVDFQ